MIQNIVIPSEFTISEIKSFYTSSVIGKEFKYPITSAMETDEKLSKTHKIHIEHGVCVALKYIVSFLVNAFKYINITMLHEMGISNKKGYKYPFVKDSMDNNMKCYKLCFDNDNLKEFEYGLKLLNENINHLCIECGVKQNKLKYYAFIENLILLRTRLIESYKKNQTKSINIKKKRIVHKKQQTKHNKNVSNFGSYFEKKEDNGDGEESENESISNDQSSDEWEKI